MGLNKTDRDPGDVARRLRRARERAGFATPRMFAESAQVSLVTYYHHENGRRALTRESAAIYARHLNISPAQLLYGEGLQLPPEIRIIGTLRKGGRIAGMRDGSQPRIVAISPDLANGMVGVSVVGDDNLPSYHHGDTVMCRPLAFDGTYDRANIHEMDCVVRLATGNMMIALVIIEDDGSVTLKPHAGRIMRDVEISGAEPILLVIKQQRGKLSERVAA